MCRSAWADALVFRVRDNGYGISAETRRSCFSATSACAAPNGSRSREAARSVHRQARRAAHGGDAWVEASRGGGTFALAIPLSGANLLLTDGIGTSPRSRYTFVQKLPRSDRGFEV